MKKRLDFGNYDNFGVWKILLVRFSKRNLKHKFQFIKKNLRDYASIFHLQNMSNDVRFVQI